MLNIILSGRAGRKMNAVGKVGTFFAQSVYTVSGPFHPFGGAVDIIVVQQEDGTFKSSPWYVKFGKFQGVLKRREKKVVVAVNDGDANFHMYLDHKGEAYFLKDAPGEEVATFSPPEAVSSGDENSSHMLALEYPRAEEGANPRAGQLGKDESEDEKGDDMELRFEGRDASKQLIQQSGDERATAAGGIVGEGIYGAQGSSVNSSGDVEIPESSPRAEEVLSISDPDHPTSTQPKAASEAGGRKREDSNGKVMHALLKKAVGMEAGTKSTPASAVLANAALAALQSQASSPRDDIGISPIEESNEAAASQVRRTLSKNGIFIHGLLNQAIGLQPSHPSGPGSGLLATAILASLRKAVSDSPSGDDLSFKTPQVELVLPDRGGMDVEKNHEDTRTGSPVPELKDDSASNPNAAPDPWSFTSNGNTSADDVTVIKTVASLGSLSGLSDVDQSDIEEQIPSGSISPSRTAQFFDVKKTLEVRKLEILDKTLVVEVQEHVEKNKILGSIGSEEQKDISDAEGRVESIVVDRKKVMDKVHDLQGSSGRDESMGGGSSKDAHKTGSTAEKDVSVEDAGKLVIVHVDKRLVENLRDALAQGTDGGAKVIFEEEKVLTAPSNEVAAINSQNSQVVRSLEVTIPAPALPVTSGEPPSTALDQVQDNSTQDFSTPGKELALLNPVLSDVSSPRMKAAIELEMAWREVMEKAAATLKGAPYTSKKFNYSLSYKKGVENGEKKSDSSGRLPQQSERKTWGGWLWGGSSAPQAKQTDEQSGSKDGKDVPRELGGYPRDLDPGSAELRDPSGSPSDLEDVSKSGIHAIQNVEGSDGNVEAEGKGAQSESDSGQTDNRVGRGKPQDQLDFISDIKGQQKVPDVPPPRRRLLFGLLSRTSTNQSSLSSASSLQSNEDVYPMLDGLKRETSVERAESVVDLLDETWARGSEAHRARVGDCRTVKLEQESKVDGEICEGRSAGPSCQQSQDVKLNSETFEGSSAGDALKRVEGTSNFLVSADPEDGLMGDGSRHSHSSSILEAARVEMVVAQLGGTQDEDPIVSTTKFDQDAAKDGDAEPEDEGGNRQLVEVPPGGVDEVAISASSVSHNNTRDLTSSSNVDLLLMSVDGSLVRAPLGLGNNDAPPLAGDIEKVRRSGNSPQKLVCFAGVSDDQGPSLRADTHSLARNTVQGLCTQISDSTSHESDRHLCTDSSEGKPASPGFEGLKGLAKLVEYDSVGAGQQMDSLCLQNSKNFPIETAPDGLGPHSRSVEALGTNGRRESGIDATDPNEFDEMRAFVFEKLGEENEGDALDTDKGQVERFYSSKDLTEAEEEEEKRGENIAFKRNLSVYMDAISGEDEQDSSGSAHEDALDQSRDKSGPIGIPGAQNWAQNFTSEKEHILRSASVSLPTVSNILVNSDAVSPRLTLSRSLDSASPLSVLSPGTREQSASSDSVLTTRPSTRSPLNGSENGLAEVSVVDRTPGKVEGESEQLSGAKHKPGTQTSTAASMDDGGTGFEVSLCRHLLKERMGLEAAAMVFASEKVTVEEFKKCGSAIAANDKLVVRVGGRYYPWIVAAPIVLGILAFGQVLTAPNEGAIPVEQPIVVFDGKVAANVSTTSGGGWKLWPFGAIRRPKTPERALLSRDAMMIATEAALKSSVTYEYLRMAGYYKKPRKVRTNSPSSQQLASLNLKEGSNKITFTFETRVWGKQQVDARIYLWKWATRIVISDVDGTITKSDVLGQVMPLMGRDWTQIGVARLFSAIKKNGYELLFLSARAISQAYLTRQFLENIKQDGEALPDGPVVISPDGLFPSLYREVIRRAPHEFKIACLEDIKSLFPPESKPFYAGFGNRDTDELSYLKVGISKGKIFIINPKGDVVVNNQVDVKSYTSLHKLVDDMFPAMSFTEQEDYNEWNFWKLPLPEIDDESSVNSVGSSSSRRSGKSGRHS